MQDPHALQDQAQPCGFNTRSTSQKRQNIKRQPRTTQPTTSAKKCLPEQLFPGYQHPLESPPHPRHSRTADIGTHPISLGTEQSKQLF